jgi:Uma2 family endonuclease
MVTTTEPKALSLEDFLTHPPDGMEWVDGQLVEKADMTFKHSLAQANFAR